MYTKYIYTITISNSRAILKRFYLGIETPLRELTREVETDGEDGALGLDSTNRQGSTSITADGNVPTDSSTSSPTITSVVGHQMLITQDINTSKMKERHEQHLAYAREFGQPLLLDLSTLSQK